MYLYLLKWSKSHSSTQLIRECLKEYIKEKELMISDYKTSNVTIEYEENGKPYFKDFPRIFFSVSHSGNRWACAFDSTPIGFDMEDLNRIGNRRHQNKIYWERVAKRFFTQEEFNYVLNNGNESFFEIWVRKEAYLKYKGTGIGQGLSTFNLVVNDKLSEQIEDVNIGGIKLSPDILAAYCTKDKIKVEKIVNLTDK